MVTIALLLSGLLSFGMAVGEPQFLSEDAQVACRAILPNCFTRTQWRRLCLEDASIKQAFSQACAAAAYGRPRDDAAPAQSEADLSPAP